MKVSTVEVNHKQVLKTRFLQKHCPTDITSCTYTTFRGNTGCKQNTFESKENTGKVVTRSAKEIKEDRIVFT